MLVGWLEQRGQLGRGVFARGTAEPGVSMLPGTDLTELLHACLRLLELPARERVYQPRPRQLWRVPEALARIRPLFGELPEGAARSSASCHPPTSARRARSSAALASTLLASLDLRREGAVTMSRAGPSGRSQCRRSRAVPRASPQPKTRPLRSADDPQAQGSIETRSVRGSPG
jgi:segregation and condensation protein A